MATNFLPPPFCKVTKPLVVGTVLLLGACASGGDNIMSSSWPSLGTTTGDNRTDPQANGADMNPNTHGSNQPDHEHTKNPGMILDGKGTPAAFHRSMPPDMRAAARTAPPSPRNPQVVFLGDSLAQGYAIGFKLAARDARAPLVTIDHGRVSSGLARLDYYNWIDLLPGKLPDNNRDCLVIHFGANDDKPLAGLRNASLTSDRWANEYASRVSQFIDIIQARGFQCVLWVGPAPDALKSRDDHLRRVDKIYEQVARAKGIDYITLRKRYGDEAGNFVDYVIDQGKRRIVRTKDGSHFTIPGYKDVGQLILERIRGKSIYVRKGSAPILVATYN